ncbi:MAG TPA: hypothetical protein VKR26_19030, partial [Terriglobales bacterium]|nr:hypothetical protein [Terriglobales bacterium]
MRKLIAGAAAVLLLTAGALAQSPPAPRTGVVAVTMRNVRYHFTGRIAVHIYGLTGQLTPTGQNPFPIFDDARS